jgi:GNAT superfamily N-acetyltransferase
MQFDLLRPQDLHPDVWRHLQEMSRKAFGNEMPLRTQADIDHLTAWAEPERYYRSHIDPNSEVGQHYYTHQRFFSPRLAIALDSSDIIGFGYAANNVSGSFRERAVKMLGTQKKYLWLRELAVEPDCQQHGIGKHILRILLMSGSPLQPVTAYIWPDEIRFLPNKLRKYGFEPDGEDSVKLFGENTEPVRQVRMVAKAAGSAALKLAN